MFSAIFHLTANFLNGYLVPFLFVRASGVLAKQPLQNTGAADLSRRFPEGSYLNIRSLRVCAAVAALATLPAVGSAATMTLGPATTVSGDADVSTTGTLD